MSTVPLFSSVAVCPARAVLMLEESTRKPAAGLEGSNISADDSGPVAPVPPATSTRPLRRSVAVWSTRAVVSVALAVETWVAGSKISETATIFPARSRPPVIRIRPSDSAVAVCPVRGTTRAPSFSSCVELEASISVGTASVAMRATRATNDLLSLPHQRLIGTFLIGP